MMLSAFSEIPKRIPLNTQQFVGARRSFRFIAGFAIFVVSIFILIDSSNAQQSPKIDSKKEAKNQITTTPKNQKNLSPTKQEPLNQETVEKETKTNRIDLNEKLEGSEGKGASNPIVPVDKKSIPTPLEKNSPKDSVKDRIPLGIDYLPFFRLVEDDATIRNENDNPDEFRAYNYTILHAHSFTVDQLHQYADNNLSFADLVKPSRKLFQFQLVEFSGRLVRIQPISKIPRSVQEEAPEIKTIYEGWLYPANDRNNSPISIVFTDLPEGMEPGRELTYQVHFPGYYFKLMRYESSEKDEKGKNIWRVAPLLIGRSVIRQEEFEDITKANSSISSPMVALVICLVILLGGIIFGLNWWFSRGDKKIKSKLHERVKNPFGQKDNTSGGDFPEA